MSATIQGTATTDPTFKTMSGGLNIGLLTLAIYHHTPPGEAQKTSLVYIRAQGAAIKPLEDITAGEIVMISGELEIWEDKILIIVTDPGDLVKLQSHPEEQPEQIKPAAEAPRAEAQLSLF